MTSLHLPHPPDCDGLPEPFASAILRGERPLSSGAYIWADRLSYALTVAERRTDDWVESGKGSFGDLLYLYEEVGRFFKEAREGVKELASIRRPDRLPELDADNLETNGEISGASSSDRTFYRASHVLQLLPLILHPWRETANNSNDHFVDSSGLAYLRVPINSEQGRARRSESLNFQVLWNAIWSLNLTNLFEMPIYAMIDFGDFRYLVTPLTLRLSSDTPPQLFCGRANPGWEVCNSQVSNLLKQICEAALLKRRLPFREGVDLEISSPNEILLLADSGKLAFWGPGGLLPNEPEQAEFFYRPEAMEINSISESIISLSKKIDNLSVLIDGPESLRRNFHANGLNMRHLGKVFHLLTLPSIKELIVCEMIGRICKRKFREKIIGMDPSDWGTIVLEISSSVGLLSDSIKDSDGILKLTSSYFQVLEQDLLNHCPPSATLAEFVLFHCGAKKFPGDIGPPQVVPTGRAIFPEVLRFRSQSDVEISTLDISLAQKLAQLSIDFAIGREEDKMNTLSELAEIYSKISEISSSSRSEVLSTARAVAMTAVPHHKEFFFPVSSRAVFAFSAATVEEALEISSSGPSASLGELLVQAEACRALFDRFREYDLLLPSLTRITRNFEDLLGLAHPITSASLIRLGQTHLRVGREKSGLEILTRAAAAAEQCGELVAADIREQGIFLENVAFCNFCVAGIHLKRRNFQQAKVSAEKAVVGWEGLGGGGRLLNALQLKAHIYALEVSSLAVAGRVGQALVMAGEWRRVLENLFVRLCEFAPPVPKNVQVMAETIYYENMSSAHIDRLRTVVADLLKVEVWVLPVKEISDIFDLIADKYAPHVIGVGTDDTRRYLPPRDIVGDLACQFLLSNAPSAAEQTGSKLFSERNPAKFRIHKIPRAVVAASDAFLQGELNSVHDWFRNLLTSAVASLGQDKISDSSSALIELFANLCWIPNEMSGTILGPIVLVSEMRDRMARIRDLWGDKTNPSIVKPINEPDQDLDQLLFGAS